VLAVPSRGAHAIDYEGITALGVLFDGVGVLDGVEFDVVGAALIQFGEKWLEPVLLFVINGDWLWHADFLSD